MSEEKNDTAPLGPNEYRCDHCGGVYEKTRPEDEVLEEERELFGENCAPEDRAIICEDCWQALGLGELLEQTRAGAS